MDNKKIISGALLLSVAMNLVLGYKYFNRQDSLELDIVEAIKSPEIIENLVKEVGSPEELRELLKNPKEKSVVSLYMNGCGWCNKMAPELDGVASNPEFASMKFYRADGSALQASPMVKELCDQQINGYPSLLFMNEKGYVDKQVGFAKQEDLEDKIKRAFSNSPVIEVGSQQELRELLKNPQEESVVSLYMNGCGWCTKMAPVVDAVASNPEFASMKFYRVDGNALQAPSVVKELCDQEINGYPSLLFMNEKGYVDKQVGFAKQEDLEAKIKRAFSNSPVIEVGSQQELRELLKNPQEESVVSLYMNGCGWCTKMAPVVDAVASNPEFASMKFYRVDGNALQAPSVVKELCDQEINGYPSLLFMNEKGYVDKQVGFAKQEDLEAKIKRAFSK